MLQWAILCVTSKPVLLGYVTHNGQCRSMCDLKSRLAFLLDITLSLKMKKWLLFSLCLLGGKLTLLCFHDSTLELWFWKHAIFSTISTLLLIQLSFDPDTQHILHLMCLWAYYRMRETCEALYNALWHAITMPQCSRYSY